MRPHGLSCPTPLPVLHVDLVLCFTSPSLAPFRWVVKDEERRRSGASAEALHVETASALAALDALAAGLGAFLAPYLPRVLALVLQRSLLTCSAPQVAGTAAHAWRVLTDAVPPRLLLPPLFAHLDAALEVPAHPLLLLSFECLPRSLSINLSSTISSLRKTCLGWCKTTAKTLKVRQVDMEVL